MTRRTARLLSLGGLACAILFSPSLLAQTPAFPGALGFGAYATGGRNGSVYHVTTLADSGAGSFRTGVGSGNRVIVFDVGGHITLLSAVTCQGNLTIAGQTAPGGICFDAGEVSFSARANIVCRYVRIRPGSNTSSVNDDCLGMYETTNAIFDHVSVGFGPYDNIDAVTANNLSFQNCIDSNPIGQQFGAHMENVGAFCSWQYNLFINSHNRNPLAKINDTFINNVEYNGNAGYTTHTSTPFKHDIVNNYFVAGPAFGGSGDFPWYQVDKNQSIYYSGNLFDGNDNGTLDGSTTTPYWYQGTGTVLSSPWSSWTAVIPTVSAPLAWRYVVSAAGAFPRDDMDALIISQAKTLGSGTTGTGAGTAGPGTGLYTSQTQTGLANSGYGTFTGGTAPANYAGDGIADYWKLANNLSTNVSYPLTNTADGYTLLEHYLNFLGAPHAVTRSNTPVTVNLSQFTAGFAASSTYSLTNITNGTVSLVSGTNVLFTPTANFIGLGTFTFTVTEGSYAISAPVTVCVTPIAPPASATNFFGALVAVATNSTASTIAPPNNLTWHGDGTANAWNTTSSNWLNGGVASKYKDYDVVTFDDTTLNTNINLTATVSPGAIYFNDNQNYTLTGSGALSGFGALSKTGTGTVTLGTTNSGYSGDINISGGTLALTSGSSLGSGAITLSGGATLALPGGNTANLITGNVTVPAGENVTNTSGYVANGGYGNFISGDSTSVLNFVGSQSFAGANSSQFSGFTGTINIVSGSIRFSNTTGGSTFGSLSPNFIINGTLQPRNAGNTIVLGGLNGAGQLAGPQFNSGTGNTVYNIGGKNQDSTFNGVIISNSAVAGSLVSLVKVGTGTQTLNGNNTFTGTNAVMAGALLVNGLNTPSLTTVFTNATLGGSGAFTGPVTVKTGGSLSPGAAGSGSIGTLTISNNLTLAASDTLAFDLTSSPSGVNDQILIPGGLLTLSNPQNFVFNLVNNALGAGTYVLITGGTNTSAAGVGFNSNLPGSTRQTFAFQRPTSGNGQCYVQLVVGGSAAALVWKGTNGNTWDLSTTTNWLNAGNADMFYNLDQVIFNDTATNGGVNLSGNVSPATLLVTNNATSFTFSNGTLSGFTALVKIGAGVLNLNASNSFTGGVSIGGGTVNVNNGYALGTGPVTLTGGTLHFNSVGTGEPITVTGTNTLQFSAASANIYSAFNLSGSGRLNLTIDGNDVFTPSGDWSGFSGYIYFTGSKNLRAFSANVGSANAVWDLGSSTASLYNQAGGYTIYLGALFGGSGTSLSGASSAGVGTTTYQVGDLNTNCTFNGIIADNASPTALVKSGSATLTLTGTNTFTGGTTVNSGTLCVNNVAGSGTGTGDLEIFSGATLTGAGFIGSSTTIDNGATLAPGNPSGTLTITNNLTLNDNSILQFGLGTNSDAVTVSGDLALTGLLSVTNAGGFGPGSYPLFTCTGALNFGNLQLVAAPAGYSYSFNTNTAGVVKLVVALPAIGSSAVNSGGRFVFSGTGGTPGGTYYVVTSTNLATAVTNWTRVLTNQFDGSGNFSVTNNPATNAQYFYRLQLQ
jgi:autotransporter-associated beta strand protein